ncbi:hypothetical protein F2P81_026359 [Scophthalmus maximus]|uniref:NR LBD domain-containing protein n=1 Tax=Scophthalmus maximus TaxID=52904 RepID=A0A6A4RMM1_SCOMX|nr:hypothetical protein F2P81_026359 [Scophthalmus maximus]
MVKEVLDSIYRLAPSVSDLCTSSPQTAEELESRSRLLRLLDSVIDALVWTISKMGLSTQQQTLRLGHLTMLLSHIRHVRYRVEFGDAASLTGSMYLAGG